MRAKSVRQTKQHVQTHQHTQAVHTQTHKQTDHIHTRKHTQHTQHRQTEHTPARIYTHAYNNSNNNNNNNTTTLGAERKQRTHAHTKHIKNTKLIIKQTNTRTKISTKAVATQKQTEDQTTRDKANK